MYNVHFAKTNLSKLLQDVEDGKQVVLARGKKAIARMTMFSAALPGLRDCYSKSIKIEKRECCRVGDTVVYFCATYIFSFLCQNHF